MPSSGDEPTLDNPAHLSHVPDWKKRYRRSNRTDYDRALDAVRTALERGLITIRSSDMKDRDQQISDLAEFFQVALGTNEN